MGEARLDGGASPLGKAVRLRRSTRRPAPGWPACRHRVAWRGRSPLHCWQSCLSRSAPCQRISRRQPSHRLTCPCRWLHNRWRLPGQPLTGGPRRQCFPPRGRGEEPSPCCAVSQSANETVPQMSDWPAVSPPSRSALPSLPGTGTGSRIAPAAGDPAPGQR